MSRPGWRRTLTSFGLSLAIVGASANPTTASSPEWPATFLASAASSAGIAVDRAGAFHVAYVTSGGTFQTWYGTNASGTWSWVNVATGHNGVPAIAVDVLDHVHIAQGCAYLSDRTGTWKTKILPCAGGATVDFNRLAVDPIGEVHLAGRASDGTLIYSTNRRGFWTSQNLGPINGQATIALDGDRRVHVAAGSEYFTNVTGQWTKTTIPFSGPAFSSSVAFRDGVVRIMGNTASGLEYAERTGSSWNAVKLGKGDSAPLFAVDGSGNGHVAVLNAATGAFDYLTDTSGPWVRTQGVAKEALGLAAAPGRPALLVAGLGYGGVDLRLATNVRLTWQRTLASPATFQGAWVDLDPSIAANAAGTARAAWTWPEGKGPGGVAAPGLYVANWRPPTSTSHPGWVNSRITETPDSMARIAVDAAGHSYVVVRRATGENAVWDMWYGTDASGTWVWDDFDLHVRLECLRLGLGPTGHAFVTYDRTVPGTTEPHRVVVASNRTGTWSITPLPPDTPVGNEACPAIDVDKNDRAHMVFYLDGQLKYVSDVAAAGTYVVQASWEAAERPAIAVDAHVKAHILFQYAAAPVYRTNVSGAWTDTTLGGLAERNRGLAIEVRSSGPIAAWGGGGIQVAQPVGGSWQTTALAGLQTLHTGLAVGPAGRAWIIYAEEQFTSAPSVYAFAR